MKTNAGYFLKINIEKDKVKTIQQLIYLHLQAKKKIF